MREIPEFDGFRMAISDMVLNTSISPRIGINLLLHRLGDIVD